LTSFTPNYYFSRTGNIVKQKPLDTELQDLRSRGGVVAARPKRFQHGLGAELIHLEHRPPAEQVHRIAGTVNVVHGNGGRFDAGLQHVVPVHGAEPFADALASRVEDLYADVSLQVEELRERVAAPVWVRYEAFGALSPQMNDKEVRAEVPGEGQVRRRIHAQHMVEPPILEGRDGQLDAV